MKGRASRPSLIHQKLWQSRRKHYLAVFENALMLLRQRHELPVDELGLVRELHFASVTARRTLDPTGRFGSPVFEAQNLPNPDSARIEAFEHKRPDIQWIHDDESAIDDRTGHCSTGCDIDIPCRQIVGGGRGVFRFHRW